MYLGSSAWPWDSHSLGVECISTSPRTTPSPSSTRTASRKSGPAVLEALPGYITRKVRPSLERKDCLRAARSFQRTASSRSGICSSRLPAALVSLPLPIQLV